MSRNGKTTRSPNNLTERVRGMLSTHRALHNHSDLDSALANAIAANKREGFQQAKASRCGTKKVQRGGEGKEEERVERECD